MRRFAETAQDISKTSSRLKKVGLLAAYLLSLPDEDLRASTIFFTGRPFALADSRTLNVGGAALVRALQEITAVSDVELSRVYLDHGDLGDAARVLLPSVEQSARTPSQLYSTFEVLARTPGAGQKQQVVLGLLRVLTPSEGQFVMKIITGDLRVGLKESTVEEAIAKAFDRPADVVRRTNMTLGDIGETAIRARYGTLAGAGLELFRPVKFMLASSVDSEEAVFSTFSRPFYVEDKYDGIRAQFHVNGVRAALYSRTLDDVSGQFPEIIAAAGNLNTTVIADGEIVAYRDQQVLSFGMLQKRLGRKRPSPALIAEIPVAFIVFDLLLAEGRTLIDEALRERKSVLGGLSWQGCLVIAPSLLLEKRIELEPMFEQAALRRNEGLMLKAADSIYAPGKRGKSWLKWKKTLATLDVVVTGVEYGHGRRRDVLSDYTFAVQRDGELLNIGKAYSGLTDTEILEMTEFFKQHTVQDFGRFRLVQPLVVIEVAFNGIQKSSRHKSGFALRFPRIVRIRTDKSPEEVDTLESVEKLAGS